MWPIVLFLTMGKLSPRTEIRAASSNIEIFGKLSGTEVLNRLLHFFVLQVFYNQ